MASNQHNREDDEYQAQDDDEEDDEQTIEEEEQLGSDDEQNELDDLEAGANVPLEELLKMYGQNSTNVNTISRENNKSNATDEEKEEEYEHRCRLHPLLQVNGKLLPEDDDDDESDDSFEPEIIKVPNIGDEYQADVSSHTEFDPINGPFDEREVFNDKLVWSPSSVKGIDNGTIDEYLKTIRSEFPHADEEISLEILLNSQMNTDLALVNFRQLPVKTNYSYREWSIEEIQQFEEGLREYGKNFFKITVFKCPNRTFREVIHYYYQWKKSERYHVFIEEEQRMSAITSVTDMIERFIEQQEQQLCMMNSTNSSVISNDLKINSTVSYLQTSTTTTTTKRSYDQVENDSDPSSSSSKKPTLNNTNSPPSTTTTIV